MARHNKINVRFIGVLRDESLLDAIANTFMHDFKDFPETKEGARSVMEQAEYQFGEYQIRPFSIYEFNQAQEY